MTDRPDECSSPEMGVIYVAMGTPFLAMALISGASVRALNPRTPICVITNAAPDPDRVPWWEPEMGDRWIFLDRPTEENRLIKTDLAAHTPYAKSLFLDCDTLVTGKLDLASLLLDHFDVVLRPAGGPCNIDGDRPVLPEMLQFRDLPHFNGGVVGFRKNPRVSEFFQTWRRKFIESKGTRDQPPLVEALFASDVRLYPLRVEWNHGDYWKLPRSDRERIVVWHYKWRSLDRRMEDLIREAGTWVSRGEQCTAVIEEYLSGRRALRRPYHPRELYRSALRELRGPLSKAPEVQAGSDRWNRLLGR